MAVALALPEGIEEGFAAYAVDLVANERMELTKSPFDVKPVGHLLMDGELLGHSREGLLEMVRGLRSRERSPSSALRPSSTTWRMSWRMWPSAGFDRGVAGQLVVGNVELH